MLVCLLSHSQRDFREKFLIRRNRLRPEKSEVNVTNLSRFENECFVLSDSTHFVLFHVSLFLQFACRNCF